MLEGCFLRKELDESIFLVEAWDEPFRILSLLIKPCSMDTFGLVDLATSESRCLNKLAVCFDLEEF